MDPAKSAVKGEQMTEPYVSLLIKFIVGLYVISFVLTFASLFGLFVAMVFGVAPLLLGLLAMGVFVGVGLFVLSSSFWDLLPFPEEKPKKKRINSVGK